jgi:hypothetical protein
LQARGGGDSGVSTSTLKRAAAVEAGLADEVVAPVDVRASVPRLPADRFTNAPAALLKPWADAIGSLSLEDNPNPSLNPMTSQSQAGGAPAATTEVQPVAAAATEAVTAQAQAPQPVAASNESATVAALRREADIRRCAASAGLAADVVQAMVDNGKPFTEVAMEIVTAHAAVVEAKAKDLAVIQYRKSLASKNLLENYLSFDDKICLEMI